LEETTTMASPKKTTKPKKTAAAPKAPAATKTSKKPEFGAKTEFVKSQPTSMTAKEVVEAAKAKGITLSENLVYAARAAGRKKGGASKKTKGSKKGASKAKPGRKPEVSGSKGSGSLEATLRNAIAELGLARARAIFAGVEKAFGGG
jgi:hypothetical protein